MNSDNRAPRHRRKLHEPTVLLQRNGLAPSKELPSCLLRKLHVFDSWCTARPFHDFNGLPTILCSVQQKPGYRHPMTDLGLVFLACEFARAKEDHALHLCG